MQIRKGNPMSTDNKALCELCGEPMPKGEEMFKFHGYSGGCPKPPMKSESMTPQPKTEGVPSLTQEQREAKNDDLVTVMPAKKYKFITIRCENEEMFEGRPVYRVFNNRSKGQLAVLSYYKPWKQYVFSSHNGMVFNDGCLKDILNFFAIIQETSKP